MCSLCLTLRIMRTAIVINTIRKRRTLLSRSLILPLRSVTLFRRFLQSSKYFLLSISLSIARRVASAIISCSCTQISKFIGVLFIATSVCNGKRSFYRAVKCLGMLGASASEEVLLSWRTGTVYLLVYGLESCLFNKPQAKSLDFATDSAISVYFSYAPIDNCKTPVNCDPA